MSLVKIEPLHPNIILPLGDDGRPAVQVDVTEKGVPVYRLKRIRAGKHIPRLDADGKQVVVKNENTGAPMYKKWRRELREWDQLITLESDGHGTLYMNEYVQPTPEELERNERERKAAEFKDRLALAAAERGISADVFLDRIMAQQDDVIQPGDEGAPSPEYAPEAQFPKNYAPGRWELSDGTKMQGSKEAAQAAEAALQPAEF